MDPKKWLPTLPLFGTPACVYCGGPADTSDHTPPRCLLPKRLPNGLQSMVAPACSACNSGFSHDENRVAAVVATVSFTSGDRVAVAKGGSIFSALQRDPRLHAFVHSRLGSDGIFRPDEEVISTISRIMRKTTVGLLFYEFGRIVSIGDMKVIRIEHSKNINPTALVESHRHEGNDWAEVTPSGRELERQVVAVLDGEPPHTTEWQVYIPEFFEYMFIRRSNAKLLTALKIHDALTVLLECPWPSRAGPRRKRKRGENGGGTKGGRD